MCEFNSKITIVQLLRLTMVSAKSKLHSPRRNYLPPGKFYRFGNRSCFVVFISVTNSCPFWGSFIEIQACFQQICLFSRFMHALRTYGCHELIVCCKRTTKKKKGYLYMAKLHCNDYLTPLGKQSHRNLKSLTHPTSNTPGTSGRKR